MGSCLSACSSGASGKADDKGHREQVANVSAGATAGPGPKQAKTSDGHKRGEPPRPKNGTHQALRLLGRGAAADTWLFRDVKLREPVAIKMFPRPLDYYPVDAIQREVLTQTELGPGHMNLINVYELFLTPESLGLVMECAEGGSLTSYVGQRIERAGNDGLVLAEDEALYLFKQFISAVAYCHSHQIAHRDLKLDNTLLDGSDPPVLKICDFGFARHFTKKFEKTKSHLGTPEYMSPELLHKTAQGDHDNYDARRVDVWASGVLLLVCLCGAFPFDHTARDTDPVEAVENDLWMQEVSKNWRDAVSRRVGGLSPEVADLLDKIFVVDPKNRITVEGIERHPWYCRDLPAKYKEALDGIAVQQKALQQHVSEQRFDREKVTERSRAVADMVAEASRADGGAKKRTALRPLHVIDMTHADLVSIDLTERAVVQGTAASNSGKLPAVVKERFDRESVKGTVDQAFSSQNNLNDIISGSSRSRSAVGGGQPG